MPQLTHAQEHAKKLGLTLSNVGATTADVGGTLSAQQLKELIRGVEQTGGTITVVSGVVKINF